MCNLHLPVVLWGSLYTWDAACAPLSWYQAVGFAPIFFVFHPFVALQNSGFWFVCLRLLQRPFAAVCPGAYRRPPSLMDRHSGASMFPFFRSFHPWAGDNRQQVLLSPPPRVSPRPRRPNVRRELPLHVFCSLWREKKTKRVIITDKHKQQ